MARRRRRESGTQFSIRRYVKLALLVGFVAWVAIAYSVPLSTYGSLLGVQRYSSVGTYTLHIPGIAPVRYSAAIDYSTTGSFSVGTENPIHMEATVYDVNSSDFGSLFEAIDLLYQAVPIGSNGSALLPYLRAAGPGNWTAHGLVEFGKPINFTGPELVPTTLPANSSLVTVDSSIISQVKAYNYPFPQLRSQSYTDSLVSTEWAIRLAATGSAVLLLLLIPVFDRMILPERDRKAMPDDA